MALLHSEQLPENWEAQDFNLKDTDGSQKSLQDFGGKKGVLIAFTCNHCPYAKASWPILIDLYNEFKEDVRFVAINPNDANEYPEDSFEAMQQKKEEWGIPFSYVYDESQETAKAYNAQCTPDLYLFKTEGDVHTLFYHGRINDDWQEPEQVKEENLKDALSRLTQNQEPPQEQPSSMGCSIKWKE